MSVILKIDKLISELERSPRSGTGHPEPLGGNKENQWSRRVNKKHRLVYNIDDENMKVILLSVKGHYNDK
jgi:toxin YoeB